VHSKKCGICRKGNLKIEKLVSDFDRNLWIVAGLLFLALIAAAIYKFQPLLNPELAAVAPVNPDCDLRSGPCVGKFPDGTEVSFSIEPRTIPLVKPLQLKATVNGVSAHGVEVDFIGLNMEIGFNRSRLKPNTDGSFDGTGVLPVCIMTVMEWEARVLVQTEQGLIAAPFRFNTVRDGYPLSGQ
jgi:hypothetical protein